MKLNQEYLQMILNQGKEVGNASFRDVVAALCGR
jgi:hypothetical protein